MRFSSNSSFYTSTKSLNMSSAALDAKPFSQQFDYHLADVPIQRKKNIFIPIGVVIVFFPGIQEFEVEIRRREPIEELRKSIEAKISVSIEDYYVVSKKGIIEDGHTLDDYRVEDHSDLVLIEKGIMSAQHDWAMKQWIDNRKRRRKNPEAKIFYPVQQMKKPKPKKVERKAQEKTSLEALGSFLKSVKLENLL